METIEAFVKGIGGVEKIVTSTFTIASTLVGYQKIFLSKDKKSSSKLPSIKVKNNILFDSIKSILIATFFLLVSAYSLSFITTWIIGLTYKAFEKYWLNNVINYGSFYYIMACLFNLFCCIFFVVYSNLVFYRKNNLNLKSKKTLAFLLVVSLSTMLLSVHLVDLYDNNWWYQKEGFYIWGQLTYVLPFMSNVPFLLIAILIASWLSNILNIKSGEFSLSHVELQSKVKKILGKEFNRESFNQIKKHIIENDSDLYRKNEEGKRYQHKAIDTIVKILRK